MPTIGADLCTLTINPDLAGVGVRVAFYVEALLCIVCAPFISDPKLWISLARWSLFYNLCLLLSTIILLKTSQNISLVDGLVVTTLSSLSDVAVYNAVIWKEADTSAKTLRLALFSNSLVYYVLGITVWASAPIFGLSSDCHTNAHVVFALIGFPVRATVLWLRVLMITLMSLGLLIAAIGFMSGSDLKLPPFMSIAFSRHGNSESLKRWLLAATMPLSVATCVLTIVTTERTLSVNGLRNGTVQWTLGQLMAVLLLGHPIGEIVTKVFSIYFSEKKHGNCNCGFSMA
ncbi:hypothetical protein JAAARDRAFT_36358 [Jaapia argillacea MUCL 33604]|uniref:Transmembrane protein n=1 Tax=Jaapia argillacea MUCL 33604 TaxID=933084 RepID=A0A067PST0_9AGAM|nr:hypothetical protein JAAARDRAFT_36358 [Jaapia argillacea MUCL 33604]